MTDFAPVHQELVDRVPLRPGARIEEEVVTYDHDGTTLEGFVVHDAAITGAKPAVVVVHDWYGLKDYPKARAHMLARLGFYVFCADVYGQGRRFEREEDCQAEAGKFYGDLPLLRARVGAAYDRVVLDERADNARIAVIGYCFGGSAALEFARTGARLAATVSFHGGLVTHEPADVDKIAGPLLVLTGGADPVVPDAAVAAFQDELRTREDLDWTVTTYAGAPHAFTIVGAPVYRELADLRSWRAMLDLFGETLTV
ncbi:dienelactone hydrolase family protein [Kineosporia sp. J2-2]|uniref:Dienelactone hydrolase family protein n=1 Tax=Kineosporia corallincola TaxID=2835133 RepID=A0ABS5TKR2_9ACTN|nr:dienelactone hydrolase family protein [Kineosporia corallincola]MBT0771693.1 dienelactone hydrolase family protein [Kineosporia corallincola]